MARSSSRWGATGACVRRRVDPAWFVQALHGLEAPARPDPLLAGAEDGVVAAPRGVMSAVRPIHLPSICRLTAAVLAHRMPAHSRAGVPGDNGRCACGPSGAAACGAGGVMAWGRGAWKEREGAEGVDVDYAPAAAGG